MPCGPDINETHPKGNLMPTPLQLQNDLLTAVGHLIERAAPTFTRGRTGRDERGQATAEYALVLIAAVAIAGLLIAWAKRTGIVDQVMDAVFRSLLGDAKGN